MPIGEPWENETAIIGSWPSVDDAELATRAAFEALSLVEAAAPGPAGGVARIYELGGTAWVSASPKIVAALASSMTEPTVFGISVSEDSDGKATSVALSELGIENDVLVVIGTIGSAPEDRAAEEAVLDWELRLASRSLGRESTPDPARSLSYGA